MCQRVKSEGLNCPNSDRGTGTADYKTFVNNLAGFNEIGWLPMSINLSQLDEGDGIEATFRKRNVTWHGMTFSD